MSPGRSNNIKNSNEIFRLCVYVDGSKMLLPFDDKVLNKGFCWGVYESTVDVGPRIRLSRAIVKVLKRHKVSELWRYPDPTGRRIIICPSRSRLTYIKAAKQNLPSSMELEQAYRKFICSGEPIPFKEHGKVSITTGCNENLRITVGQQVVIVGVGFWYEVCRLDDWTNSLNSQVKSQRSYS